ncbi:MAG: ATP-binding protein [Holophagales bacterium]|jgi:predicted AAA+ superfamily ATPase|nr:ATP-binding protein [Holophagales bacterium]
MLPRQEYIDSLIRFRDKPLIKIVTGIRRCGKRTLFEQFQEYLRKDGVPDGQILNLNFEYGGMSPDTKACNTCGNIKTGKQLYDYIKDKLLPGVKLYIFFNEMQLIEDYLKTLFGLSMKKDCDIYVTSPNTHLICGEQAALFSGRYVEIKMFPLSFKEYVSMFPNDENIDCLYANYVQSSALPYVSQLPDSRDRTRYLQGIFDAIVLKDMVTRRRFPDLLMLQRFARFIFENIGNTCSINSIAEAMAMDGSESSEGRKFSVHTVESYLKSLTDSFIFYKIGRFDIKGKQYLKTGDKYYASDIGLLCTLLELERFNFEKLDGSDCVGGGAVLENIVFLELLRRGYEVYIGKTGSAEIDFVAIGDSGTEYYQVASTVLSADGSALKRELAPLKAISDHNPKYLLTMDSAPLKSHNGIKQMNVLNWLLMI